MIPIGDRALHWIQRYQVEVRLGGHTQLSRNSVTDAELGNVLRRVQGAGATKIQDVIILR